MHIINKEIQFDAGHRVPLHNSKCKNPHGHRYRVVVHVEGELITEGPESGMVRDFSIIKTILTERVHDQYDHGFIIYEGDKEMCEAFGTYETGISKYGWKVILVPFYPTAECLAKSIYDDLKPSLLRGLLRVNVWETPTSCATYTMSSGYRSSW
jgi:6-pyruvoyltetrahydropterin/6-carboxytetrahydropterin synthase